MRLLVCGGRLYNDGEHTRSVLDYLHGVQPFTAVMGDSRFAASLQAKAWAEKKSVPFVEFRTLATAPPTQGSALPDLVLAFQTTPTAKALTAMFAKSGFRVLDAQTGQQVTA